jgi:hypothetical protein
MDFPFGAPELSAQRVLEKLRQCMHQVHFAFRPIAQRAFHLEPHSPARSTNLSLSNRLSDRVPDQMCVYLKDLSTKD